MYDDILLNVGIQTRPRPRIPGFALGGVSLAVFVLVAVVALTTQVAAPPTVAELAPQATRQITETSPELSAEGAIGNGAGQTAPRVPLAGEGSALDPGSEIETSRVRRCIGNPPRQIEDPQSPPCVAYFQGNNFGSTTKGVTGSEIRVAVGNSGVLNPAVIELYQDFFNRRFEFYGRRLALIPFPVAPPASNAVRMRQDAVTVDEEIGAFAATQYSEQDGRHFVYFDALSERKILGITTGPLGLSRADESHMKRFAPYQWDYTPSADRMFRGYGQFICNVLAGKPAIYAAPPQSQLPTRGFGIIVDKGFVDTPPYDIDPLEQALAACGVNLVVAEWDQGPASATTIMVTFQQEDVTDVMYTGSGGLLGLRLMPAASGQGFHPEWLVWNLGYQDSDSQAQFYPQDQARHILGLQVYNKTLRLEDMPHMWAAKEMDPSASPAGDEYLRLYESLLVLASGIQMTGPRLTPQAFEQALMRTNFPNPGAAGPPFYQARVGFPGVHTMQQDMAMVWLSATERSPVTGQTPSFCYAQLGKRYGLGQWPRQDIQFFQPPCR